MPSNGKFIMEEDLKLQNFFIQILYMIANSYIFVSSQQPVLQ